MSHDQQTMQHHSSCISPPHSLYGTRLTPLRPPNEPHTNCPPLDCAACSTTTHPGPRSREVPHADLIAAPRMDVTHVRGRLDLVLSTRDDGCLPAGKKDQAVRLLQEWCLHLSVKHSLFLRILFPLPFSFSFFFSLFLLLIFFIQLSSLFSRNVDIPSSRRVQDVQDHPCHESHCR